MIDDDTMMTMMAMMAMPLPLPLRMTMGLCCHEDDGSGDMQQTQCEMAEQWTTRATHPRIHASKAASSIYGHTRVVTRKSERTVHLLCA